MRKGLLLLVLVLCLGSAAQARLYFGVVNAYIVTGEVVAPALGLSVGSYDLLGPIGVRASAQSYLLGFGDDGFLEGSLDGTVSFGEGVLFYTGAGLGYSSFTGGNATLAAFLGLDLDAASTVSLFLEARPVLYLGAGSAIQLRTGFNVHLGASAAGGEDVQGECCVIP